MSRILLVEDEQVNRDLFRRRLERKGYQVLTAETGLQAVALTTSELPDLVLMDLGLPELDGWQATQRIKSNPATAVVPVIALSAHATVEAKQKAFAAGCQEFETKPVNWEVLFGKIVKALEARIMPVADNAPAPGTVPPGSPGPDKTSAAVSPETPPVGTADSPKKPAVPLEQKHILVVEDNDANRVMLCRRLNKNGFATTEARDGREALARVNERRYDLVLLDIMMPDVDGYTVLREMKADVDLQAIPVIMISAVDEMASVVQCIEMGAEDYLPKPYDPVLLQARINACLDKRRLRDQELAYMRAVDDLTKAAAAVEKGDFDPAVLAQVAAREDALGTLARVFERMANEVRAREQKLNQEVARLQVEIDRVKMTDQVQGITGTAYFETLEQKAAGLRTGRSSRTRRAVPDSPPPKPAPDPMADTSLGIPSLAPTSGLSPPPENR